MQEFKFNIWDLLRSTEREGRVHSRFKRDGKVYYHLSSGGIYYDLEEDLVLIEKAEPTDFDRQIPC